MSNQLQNRINPYIKILNYIARNINSIYLKYLESKALLENTIIGINI